MPNQFILVSVLTFSALIVSSATFCQKGNEKPESVRIGVFIGEGSGVLIEKPIYNSMLAQFSVGVNELLFDYSFLDKYSSSRKNQSYDNIYNVSIGGVYQRSIKEGSLFSYRVCLGGELRIISGYTYQTDIENLPPNTVIIDDPITTTKLGFGINYFVGLGYVVGKHLNVFADLGGYSEITDTFFWTQPQFRIGLGYSFKENGR